jgi:hypothetical protein
VFRVAQHVWKYRLGLKRRLSIALVGRIAMRYEEEVGRLCRIFVRKKKGFSFVDG